MKIGIMQPYFFPYLGYWQLMNAVDRYVVYDDVNYIKGGRVNRNKILIQNQAGAINLILSGASPNKLICELEISEQATAKKKLLRTIEMAYARAPQYNSVMPILEDIIQSEDRNLANYLYYSFLKIGNYLGIDTELILSSNIKKDCSLKSYHKVISICKILGGDKYYNSINGIPLYLPHLQEFQDAAIELFFPKMHEIQYQQFKNEFVPNLSIIDVMMFNTREKCHQLLNEYDLLKGSEIEL